MVTSGVMSWTTDDVALYFAKHPDLRVVRKYLSRESLSEVDGETLVEMNVDDWMEIGVKKMHTRKILRIVDQIISETRMKRGGDDSPMPHLALSPMSPLSTANPSSEFHNTFLILTSY